MKILYIYGDDDYGANSFESSSLSIADAVKKIEESGSNIILTDEENDNCGPVYGLIREFGDVDPKFIEFVKDEIQDYDDSKHQNFYVVD